MASLAIEKISKLHIIFADDIVMHHAINLVVSIRYPDFGRVKVDCHRNGGQCLHIFNVDVRITRFALLQGSGGLGVYGSCTLSAYTKGTNAETVYNTDHSEKSG